MQNKNKEELKIQKELLRVYSELNKEGKPRIYWDFGDKLNAYFLIGILEDIKLDLLYQIDEMSLE
ncbi:unnamed protein product [marine sediment metagenome]|uniref:Uncharacterized protein n=1 Tax=marine sediment metagenome TaxID=412755 RepID=X1D1U3_9ZZZZ